MLVSVWHDVDLGNDGPTLVAVGPRQDPDMTESGLKEERKRKLRRLMTVLLVAVVPDVVLLQSS